MENGFWNFFKKRFLFRKSSSPEEVDAPHISIIENPIEMADIPEVFHFPIRVLISIVSDELNADGGVTPMITLLNNDRRIDSLPLDLRSATSQESKIKMKKFIIQHNANACFCTSLSWASYDSTKKVFPVEELSQKKVLLFGFETEQNTWLAVVDILPDSSPASLGEITFKSAFRTGPMGGYFSKDLE